MKEEARRLVERQFSSITTALNAASKRRNSDLRRKASAGSANKVKAMQRGVADDGDDSILALILQQPVKELQAAAVTAGAPTDAPSTFAGHLGNSTLNTGALDTASPTPSVASLPTLSELDSATEVSMAAMTEMQLDDRNLQQMLAELDNDLPLEATPIFLEVDPRKLLEELELESDAARSTFTTTSTATAVPNDGGVPSNPSLPHQDTVYAPVTKEPPVPKGIFPYLVALYLQSICYDWQIVNNFCTYLFSEGPDGFKAQLGKKAYVDEVEAELTKLVTYTKAEQRKLKTFEREKYLVVTNISADAGIEELRRAFIKHPFDMIFILDERHPTNRTQAAYIRFETTEAAEMASDLTARIFGLKLHIRRAVDVFPDSRAMSAAGSGDYI